MSTRFIEFALNRIHSCDCISVRRYLLLRWVLRSTVRHKLGIMILDGENNSCIHELSCFVIVFLYINYSSYHGR